jgi:hypothetical protein
MQELFSSNWGIIEILIALCLLTVSILTIIAILKIPAILKVQKAQLEVLVLMAEQQGVNEDELLEAVKRHAPFIIEDDEDQETGKK